MSPRKNSGRRAEHDLDALGRAFGHQRTESADDGDWVVRAVTGAAAGKTYRCPGCDQEIVPGVPHLVVWPGVPEYGSGGGVGERRHWHTPCWNARGRRRRR